ncbi:MAG TPA: AAA family ATPase [Anaeromyxobacter sp.]|nr:AAA family ATPase [Anaeromyxobacter sp.]
MEESSYEVLKSFLELAPVAQKATRPLSRDARVNVEFAEGLAHFRMEGTGPRLLAGPVADPDFTLTLPRGAVRLITTLSSEDVGEFGVLFFRLVLETDPALKVKVHIDAHPARLFAHGYLGVLALGGLRVALWLFRNGVRNPSAAIERLRGRR